MPRRMNHLRTLLVLLVALCVAVLAQGPSDTNNNQPTTASPTPAPGTTPTTAPPNGNPTTPPPNGGNVPTTTPPPANNVPTTTPPTKRPGANTGATDTGSSGSDGTTPKTTTPVPSKTTKPPVVAAVNPAVTPTTPPPAPTTVAPAILVDRQVKSEYGTRTPPASDSASTANTKSDGAKVGSWLAPTIIGAVIVAALIVMTFFVRTHRSGHADEDYTTPRRGSDNFHEHPKSTTHHVTVPVLGDPVKEKVAADQSSMKAHAVGGAHHSPRANRVASSPPLMAEPNRPPSPGFGTYKQKNMEGTSVGF